MIASRLSRPVASGAAVEAVQVDQPHAGAALGERMKLFMFRTSAPTTAPPLPKVELSSYVVA
jgi:hypothetical protein